MKILFIRHGDPDYAHDSLTAAGWREAEALADYLRDKDLTKIYCSPLGRARDTAAPTLKARGQEMEIREFLKEFDARMPDPETGKERIPWDFCPEVWTGEKMHFDIDGWDGTKAFQDTVVRREYDRVTNALDALLEAHGYKREGRLYRAVRPNEDTIVLFCHLGITCVMLSHLLNLSPVVALHIFFTAPTGLTMLQTEERRKGKAQFRLRFLGATPHLERRKEAVSASGMYQEIYGYPNERMDFFKEF